MEIGAEGEREPVAREINGREVVETVRALKSTAASKPFISNIDKASKEDSKTETLSTTREWRDPKTGRRIVFRLLSVGTGKKGDPKYTPIGIDISLNPKHPQEDLNVVLDDINLFLEDRGVEKGVDVIRDEASDDIAVVSFPDQESGNYFVDENEIPYLKIQGKSNWDEKTISFSKNLTAWIKSNNWWLLDEDEEAKFTPKNPPSNPSLN